MFDLFQKWATDEDVTSVTTPVTAGENRKCHKKNDVTTLTIVTTQEGVTCKKSANQDKTSPNQEIAPDTTKKVVTPVTVVTESATESKLSNLAGPDPVTTQPEKVVTPASRPIHSDLKESTDLSPWRNLQLSELEEMDVAIKIESDAFGDLWLVSGEGSRRLADTDDPVYTVPEARRMIGLPGELVRQIHSFKKSFSGVIEHVQPDNEQGREE